VFLACSGVSDGHRDMAGRTSLPQVVVEDRHIETVLYQIDLYTSVSLHDLFMCWRRADTTHQESSLDRPFVTITQPELRDTPSRQKEHRAADE